MPELPEVEAYTRYFAHHALHRTVTRVRVLDERILGARRPALSAVLRGREFSRVRRHGKHLFAQAGEWWLHLHFGMSGDLTAFGPGEATPRFARVVFDFDDGTHLAFEDMRLFGVVEVTADPEKYVNEHRLGIDPLDPSFRLPAFRALLAKKRGAIKALLMSQDVIAGVGNLYADEALFQSGIHPRHAVDGLTDAGIRRLHTTLRKVLRVAVRRRTSGGEVPALWLFHWRAEGERCPSCGGTIRRTVVFGRTTYFCAKHQNE